MAELRSSPVAPLARFGAACDVVAVDGRDLYRPLRARITGGHLT